MDTYYNDGGRILAGTSSNVVDTGTSNEYDEASSVGLSGTLTARAKADTILNDGVLKVASGKASTSGLRAGSTPLTSNFREIYFEMVGAAANPLVTVGPDIDYSYTFSLDYSDPLNPSFVLDGKHDGFPCYEFYLNGVSLLNFDSGTNSPLALFGDGDETFRVEGALPQPVRIE